MGPITQPGVRVIIEDFAREIETRKHLGAKPAKGVINFRNELKDGIERDIYYVPVDLLRYRKDNGRISSDVLNYERSNGLLDEKSDEAQKIIGDFLREKDKQKTKELYQSMESPEGQREPAIITCDGFLINGNRRKMVLKMLDKEHPGQYPRMKVIILPGKGDVGGPPTLLEIEQIENRYQLQSEAKAEYYAFDRALSMRRKITYGMSLEEQLRDDPIYKGLDEKKFAQQIKQSEGEYLKPLECIDRYLEHLGREGLYSTISLGLGDPEGRWQAFLDYYKFVYKNLEDPRKRAQWRVDEREIGKIEDAAFKIIRKRDLPDLPKVHMIMRSLPKWLRNPDARAELTRLVGIDVDLPEEDRHDEQGNEYDERRLDKNWGQRHAAKIIGHVKEARNLYQYQKVKEHPLLLLDAALKKLNDENMDSEVLSQADLTKAMKVAREIEGRAGQLAREFYQVSKGRKRVDDMPC